MADFLTKLASRTLGLLPAAEPVAAPIFAPEPALPPPGADEPLPTRSYLSESGSRSAPAPLSPSHSEDIPPPVAPRPLPKLLQRSTPPQGVGEAVAPEAAAATDGAGDQTFPPQRSRPPVRAETTAEETLLLPQYGAPGPSLSARSSVPAQTGQTALPTQTDLPLAPTAWPEETPGPLVLPAGQRRGAALWNGAPDEPLLVPLNAALNQWAQRDPHATGLAGHGRVIGLVTPADSADTPPRTERTPDAASASGQAPPTIEISIGRVEVRVMHPPAPAARTKPVTPAEPGLSLEDYLRNQHGRRR